jgi:hypothetical protein
MRKRVLAVSLVFGLGVFMLATGFSSHIGDGTATGAGGVTLSIANVASAGESGGSTSDNFGYGKYYKCPKGYGELNQDCQTLCDAAYSKSNERTVCHAGCGKMTQAIGKAGCLCGNNTPVYIK